MASHIKMRTGVRGDDLIGEATLSESSTSSSIAPSHGRGCFQSDVEKVCHSEPYFVRHGQSNNFQQLRAWVSDCKGMLLITGKSGIGKTTLLNEFLLDLQASNSTPLYFPNPIENPVVLLDCCLRQLGILAEVGGDTLQKLKVLKTARASLDSKPALVLLADEGHRLSDEVLSLLLTLSFPDADGDCLLPVVIAGHPVLGSRLAKPPLLQQASSIRCHHQITPLNEDEIASYIQHRVHFGDGGPDAFFSEEALARVTYYSRGLPAIIKQLGDMALFTARLESQSEVTGELVERAASHLLLVEKPPVTAPHSAGLAEKVASHEHPLRGGDSDLVLLQKPVNQLESKTGKTITTSTRFPPQSGRRYRAAAAAGLIAITAYLGWLGITDTFPPQLASILSRLHTGYQYMISGRITLPEEHLSVKAPVVGSPPSVVTGDLKVGSTSSATVSLTTLPPAPSGAIPETGIALDTQTWVKRSTPNSRNGVEAEHEITGVVRASFVPAPVANREQAASSPIATGEAPQLGLTDAVQGEFAALLVVAEEHVHADRLMAPRFNNAWAIYKKILRIDPNNQDAAAGIKAITTKLIGFANDATSQGDMESARSQIRKAIRIDSEDEAVRAAWENLRTRFSSNLITNPEEITFTFD